MTKENFSVPYYALEEGAKAGPAPDAVGLDLVPVGDADLKANFYRKVLPESVKKMVEDYRNRDTPNATVQNNQEESGEVLSCWLCVDAVLRLFELDEDLERVMTQIVKKGKVSGIRIYKGRSGGQDTFVLTTTKKEEVGVYENGAKETIHRDRLEPGSRVLYIDKSHNNKYGGSLCQPNCGGTMSDS